MSEPIFVGKFDWTEKERIAWSEQTALDRTTHAVGFRFTCKDIPEILSKAMNVHEWELNAFQSHAEQITASGYNERTDELWIQRIPLEKNKYCIFFRTVRQGQKAGF